MKRDHLFMIHLVAMRVTDMLREGRVRQREVRKVPRPVEGCQAV